MAARGGLAHDVQEYARTARALSAKRGEAEQARQRPARGVASVRCVYTRGPALPLSRERGAAERQDSGARGGLAHGALEYAGTDRATVC